MSNAPEFIQATPGLRLKVRTGIDHRIPAYGQMAFDIPELDKPSEEPWSKAENEAAALSATIAEIDKVLGLPPEYETRFRDATPEERHRKLVGVVEERTGFFANAGWPAEIARTQAKNEVARSVGNFFDQDSGDQLRTPLLKAAQIFDNYNLHPQYTEVGLDWKQTGSDIANKLADVVTKHKKVVLATTALGISPLLLGSPSVTDAPDPHVQQHQVEHTGPAVRIENGVVLANSPLLSEAYPTLPTLQTEIENILTTYRGIEQGQNSPRPLLADRELALDDSRILSTVALLRTGGDLEAENGPFGFSEEQIKRSLRRQAGNGYEPAEYDASNLTQVVKTATEILDFQWQRFVERELETGQLQVADFTYANKRLQILQAFGRYIDASEGFGTAFARSVEDWDNPDSPLLDGEAMPIEPLPASSGPLNLPSAIEQLSQDEELALLTPEIRQAAIDVIEYAAERGVELVLTDGHRTYEHQAVLYAQGRNQAEIDEKAYELEHEYGRPDLANLLRRTPPQSGGIVTNAGPGQSYHNYARAFDMVRVINGRADYNNEHGWHIYEQALAAAGLECGCNWEFVDKPHGQERGFDWEEAIRHPEIYGYAGQRDISRQQMAQLMLRIATANNNVMLAIPIEDTLTDAQLERRTIEFAAEMAEAQAREAAAAMEASLDGVEQEVIDAARTLYRDHHQLLSELATEIGIDEGVLGGILQVESGTSGFFDDGSLKINFEAEYFFDRTGVNITDTGDAYAAFREAYELNPEAAYQSISMGASQIMGAWYERLGYSSASEMFVKFSTGQREQIRAMARFIQTDPGSEGHLTLLEAALAENWHEFARTYNGSGYAANEYHIKLPNATAAYRWVMSQNQ